MLGVAENQRLGPGELAGLEDLKALPTQRVERMGDNRPSQTWIVGLCSKR
jgi:hypothetical protein